MNGKVREDAMVDGEQGRGPGTPDPGRVMGDDSDDSDGMSAGWAVMWDQAALSELHPPRDAAPASETAGAGG